MNRRLLALLGLVTVSLIALSWYRGTAWKPPSDQVSPPLPRTGSNAPFVKSPDFAVDSMVELAKIDPGDLVYDLGCGDGRIIITAALQTGCRGVGFDIDSERVKEARENVRLHGVEERVSIEQRDIFQLDLSEADVVMMYLLPWMMNELVPQFEAMTPGSRIVSHNFWIDGYYLDDFRELPADESGASHGIYVYEIPLRADRQMTPGTPPRLNQNALPSD